ncbi:MAG: hypothetical protein HYY24_28670 [Verrucomicrobia bacterium]|nr:hypothetical protein [Verrucomicrobiota bacterium]
MKTLAGARAAGWILLLLWLGPVGTRAADVLGYSVLKGQFLLQTDAEVLEPDPDFAFSLLVSVDLTDFDLLANASFSGPGGAAEAMDDLGDYWSFLEVQQTLEALNAAYEWGDYTLDFESVTEGPFSCVLHLAETPLPPTPKLVNFADVQAVDATKPLTLTWDFTEPPPPDDFVQVYVSLGHASIYATPGLGQEGALNGASRSITIPPDTLDPGLIYSLNLEITRVVATNSDCYPDADGAAGTFSSTEVDLITVVPPELRLLSRPANGLISLEVVAEPDQTVVLQGSENLLTWSDLDTNTAPDGTNIFNVPAVVRVMQVFRALQR